MSDMTDDKDLKQEQAVSDAETDKTETLDETAKDTDAAQDAEGIGDSCSTGDADTADAGTDAKSSEKETKAADAAADGTDTEAKDSSAAASDDAASSQPDKKDKQIEELSDKYKRLFAEFDNFRKRTEAEKTGMFTEGERTVLLKVLPLIDNFERAIDSIPEEQKGTALADGIDKTYKAFMAQLTELGVTQIDACGKNFDANLHNAVMHIEDESAEENVVVEEFQKGYMFKDKVLRYSMVKVAN